MYLLLYTEAANLRHLPECLWFMFWIMRNSRVKMAEVRFCHMHSLQSASRTISRVHR